MTNSSAGTETVRGPAAAVREFVSSLGAAHTYDPFRNAYALFGFLWGLPVPFFSMAVDLWLSGSSSVAQCLARHPLHIFFLLHPLLFAVVFGAMGTVRHRKDAQIAHLLGELERHVDELAEANERLKELDHLKARFMANVTHELKTPLVSIRGYNEAILEGRFGPLTEKQRDGLAVAVRNVDRLQKLIEELLEFERIDSGDFKLALSDFDLVPVVAAALQTLHPQIEGKRLSVQLRLPDTLGIHADRDRIQHVLLNLLSNAVKFTPDGSAIGVTAAVGENDEEAMLTVWDRGPGIPTAAHKFLFTRFWQAEGPARKKHGGTGLGLAIVKGILDAHGTTVRIHSSEGAGTEVQFNLPLAPSRPVAEGVRHDADA